jgi:soluble lytic murein transglycosylase-like protein
MKGWLDNFGKADNANDSNVSLPEGFVGLGYNTKGRNYSPAWGGQFQRGGKLTPVSPMQQVEQAVQPTPTVPYLQTKDPAEFYKSWIQNPEYERRLKSTGYSDVPNKQRVDELSQIEQVKKERLGLLENIQPLEYDPSKRSEAIIDYYDGSTINVNPSDYKTFSKQSVEAHEIAHVATPTSTMSNDEFGIFMGSMLPLKKPIVSGVQGSKEREASKEAVGDFEHLGKPWEAKADLDALRFMMYDKGIYDITKGKKFTESDFEKVKQSFGKERVFKRFTDRMGKENFVKLMNTIAKADGDEQLPMAMGGMSIPGSVGFTYARTAGSAPSKGKYAKKTMASAQNGIMSPLLLGRKILEYIYPSEEATKTVEAAPSDYKKGLTNELLQRQAYKESTFNPAAVSPAGYKGLTQIGEGVLEDYSNKKGGKKLDPFNPKDAVELQKFAMNDLYNASFINKPDQSDSVRIAKTLAAYNWGRGNLSNYLNEQKSKGVDIYDSYDWLNNLPKETSDYVNKILLQEDPSFNKNYKKASTNPKYEEVTSLYDQKEFGGDILSAQNGQEMKFYQNGLDWKPRSMREGGITKDNQGYWNPDNWGKPVEIDSNDITMEGVYEPLLGVSDTGDTKLMKPGKNYKFKGKKVREYPVAKLGINQLDAQPMKKLNQLLNFTNNPDKDNWLDKYN